MLKENGFKDSYGSEIPMKIRSFGPILHLKSSEMIARNRSTTSHIEGAFFSTELSVIAHHDHQATLIGANKKSRFIKLF